MLTDGIVLQCAALVISMLITVDWRQTPNMRASLVTDCFSLCNDVRIDTGCVEFCMSFKRFCSKISENAQFAFLHCPVRGTVLLGLSGSSLLEYECKGNSKTSLSKYVYLFFFQVKDDKPVRPKSAILPEKDYSLSELLSQVDSGISRSFDRVKEDSCHSKENTCKRLSGISSADSAFSSQDSITLSFEKENSCGKSFSRHTTGNIIPKKPKDT